MPSAQSSAPSSLARACLEFQSLLEHNGCQIAVGHQNVILPGVNDALPLHEFHQRLGARFTTVNDAEAVADYGDALLEHTALWETVGVLDLGFRSRLCLLGEDRVRFLHGQVTNDVKKLHIGEGCYAALVTAKGKLESDLNIFCLQDELLLDFEPGLSPAVMQRLERYIVADDVQVVDVACDYGLLSVQGPKAEAIVQNLSLFTETPGAPLSIVKVAEAALGEIYLLNQPRLARSAGVLSASGSGQSDEPRREDASATRMYGFDLFVPSTSLAAVADKLVAAAKLVGGRSCGWTAFETARIEAGIPRFGADMDATNIPLECGIEARAISYTKGCYIGQEVINRVHSFGHVNREFRGLILDDALEALPARGDKLFHAGKEVGCVTSAVHSPRLKTKIAMGYVRCEVSKAGTELAHKTGDAEHRAQVVELPFAIQAGSR